MHLIAIGSFAGAIVAGAVGLLYWHWRAWQSAKRQELDAEERDFRFRQFRRRVQVSAMMAVLGVSIFVGSLINTHVHPWLYIAFWLLVLLVTLWLALLAMADMVATRMRFAGIRRARQVHEAQLLAALSRERAKRANGKPPKNV